MAHTRYYIEQMMGKKVHLILKDGTDHYGILDKAKFRNFGFSITYNTVSISYGNGISIGYCKDFVLSNIKKIELVDPEKGVDDFVESMSKLRGE